jgi:cardiolipin synthase
VRGAPRGGPPTILTLANLVTAVRVVGTGLVAWLVLSSAGVVVPALVLGALGATDWLDGALARRLGQVSTVGTLLDPTADRLLVATALATMFERGAVPLAVAVATAAREALVAGGVLVLAALRAPRVEVRFVGKVGTFALLVAYPAFLLSDGTAAWQAPFRALAWLAAVVGLAFGWGALGAYLGDARRALARRQARGRRWPAR